MWWNGCSWAHLCLESQTLWTTICVLCIQIQSLTHFFRLSLFYKVVYVVYAVLFKAMVHDVGWMGMSHFEQEWRDICIIVIIVSSNTNIHNKNKKKQKKSKMNALNEKFVQSDDTWYGLMGMSHFRPEWQDECMIIMLARSNTNIYDKNQKKK